MGSALFLGSWAVLMGPMIYGKPSLTSLKETFAYFSYCLSTVPIACFMYTDHIRDQPATSSPKNASPSPPPTSAV